MSSSMEAIITDADVNQYWELGSWISPKIMDDVQIGRLRAALGRVFQGDFDRDIYPYDREQVYDLNSLAMRKMNNAWWLNDEIRECVTSPVLGYIASRLMMTDEVRLWHDQVIWKPGAGSEGVRLQAGNVGWHQDYAYWQCASTNNMCAAWIALQDTDLLNGGMRFINGSHKWGLVAGSDTFFEQDLDKLRCKFGEDREWEEKPCVLKAGQASFHHSLCFHASGPNATNEPRLSVVAHLMPKGTSYRGRVQRHANVPLLGPDADRGVLFDGERFPRLWPPTRSLAQPENELNQ